MSDNLRYDIEFEPRIVGRKEIERSWSDLCEDLKEIFTKLGDSIPEQVGSTFDDIFIEIGDNYDDLTKSFGKTAQSAIVDSIGPYFRGEMDKVEDIWDTAWDGMELAAEKQLKTLQKSLFSTAIKLPYNIFKETVFDPEEWFEKSVKGTIKEWGTDIKDWIVNSLEGDAAYAGLDAGMEYFASDAAAAAATDAAYAGLDAGMTYFGGEAAVDAAYAGLDAGMTYFGGEAATTAAADAAYAGLDAGMTSFGGDAAMEAGIMAGGMLGPAALMGWAAAPMVLGPMMTPLMDSILGRSPLTPEDAQDKIADDFAFLGDQIDLLTERAQMMGEMFGGYLTDAVKDAAFQIDQIGDLAGFSNEQIDMMTDSLGEQASVIVEAASLSKSLNYQLEEMVDNLYGTAQESGITGDALYHYTTLMDDMIYSMNLSVEQTEAFKNSTRDLLEQLDTGSMTVEEITKALQDEFNLALEEVAASGDVTAETMRSVAESIKAIPTYWYTEYEVKVKQTGNVGDEMQVTKVADGIYEGVISHGGGLLMHGGGFLGGLPRMHTGSMVSALAHDEVPVIARRGEYVVRAESVNAATLPLLQALNQTGRAQAQTSPPQVNLHVEVHGNILGGQENMEELARIMERKLRDLNQSRYAA